MSYNLPGLAGKGLWNRFDHENGLLDVEQGDGEDVADHFYFPFLKNKINTGIGANPIKPLHLWTNLPTPPLYAVPSIFYPISVGFLLIE